MTTKSLAPRRAPRIAPVATLAGLLLVALLPTPAHAGPWTRDAGHAFVNLTYSRIATQKLFNVDGSVEQLGARYTQHALGFYGEAGLLTRWLTASIEWQPYRRAELVADGLGAESFRASTQGIGDLRLGLWSGLVTSPVRFTVAFLWSVPTGDTRPDATRRLEDERDPARQSLIRDTARSLPTGDGEADFELRASLGYSFGGKRYWPLVHYVVAEAGYWLRTAGFPDDFSYKLELGIKLPWRVIDRFWFIGRIGGIQPFLQAEDLQAGGVCQGTAAFSGLGACVTYASYGFEVFGKLWRGLGASVALDSAFHARLVPAGANLRFGLSYEY